MPIFTVHKDYETSEHAGAGGMFQIISLELEEHDVTTRVDQGLHFDSNEDLRRYISRVFGYKIQDVVIDEV